MTFRTRSAPCLAAAILFLSLAPASIASAQEAMQLDLEFRNSLSRGATSQEQGEGRQLQGRRRDASEAQKQIEVAKRYPMRRRHKKL
jgi:hypothetical protein